MTRDRCIQEVQLYSGGGSGGLTEFRCSRNIHHTGKHKIRFIRLTDFGSSRTEIIIEWGKLI